MLTALQERIFDGSMPEPNTGCWLWTQSVRGRSGYGSMSIDNRTVYAHRTSYQAFRGPIPNGKQLDHLCRVRRCVNPDHLEVVTSKINTLRSEAASAINARKTHCLRGHLFDESNTQSYVRSSTGSVIRYCRECGLAKKRRLRAAAGRDN